MTMNTVAIAGASGVVGARVLHHLLERNDVDRVVAAGRRPLPFEHDKLVSMVVDLQDVRAIAAAIPDGTAIAFCCLGTTMRTAGSREAFRAVDHDAVVAFARAAREKGARRFLLVSSVGASSSAANFYLRTKGEAEESLQKLGFEQLTVLRPSFIDDQGARRESRPLERVSLPVARLVFAVVGRKSRYAPIAADAIARAMVRLAFDGTTDRVRKIESERLQAPGGSAHHPAG
jgi:uncharacterized protein YbjT (DUF2867 family)